MDGVGAPACGKCTHTKNDGRFNAPHGRHSATVNAKTSESHIQMAARRIPVYAVGFFKNGVMKSMGTGKIVVVLRSPEISLMVCR